MLYTQHHIREEVRDTAPAFSKYAYVLESNIFIFACQHSLSKSQSKKETLKQNIR